MLKIDDQIKDVSNALKKITDKPIAKVGRAGDMVWLGFGNEISRLIAGEQRLVSEYALHIQCPWRITHNGKIIVASHDIYYPADGEDNDDFVWDIIGNNRFDKIAKKLNAVIKKGEIKVLNAKVTIFGDLILDFAKNYKLEAFLADSLHEEYWRFIINRENDARHFVVFDI